MLNIVKYKILLIILFFTTSLFALQDKYKKVDSLQEVADTHSSDTVRVKALKNLCWEYRILGEQQKAIEYCQQALQLAKEIEYKIGIAASYNNIGVVYFYQSNYEIAKKYFQKALKFYKKANSKRGIGISANNLGNISSNLGDYPAALDYFFKSLKIDRELGNKRSQAISCLNIGGVYADQGNDSLAIAYYYRSLALSDSVKDKNLRSDIYNHLGVYYNERGNYKKSNKFYKKSLQLRKTIGNKRGVAESYLNLGNTFKRAALRLRDSVQKPPSSELIESNWRVLIDSALLYQYKALAIHKEIDSRKQLAHNFRNIAHILKVKGNIQKSDQYYSKAVDIADKIGHKKLLVDVLDEYIDLLKEMGRYRTATTYLEKVQILKDSLFNERNQKMIGRLEAKYKYEKKLARERTKHKKETALAKAQTKKQQIIIVSISIGLLLLVGFVFIVINRLRVTRHQNKIIEQQNREITDSINYAQRIQSAMLKAQIYLEQEFPDRHFIFFQPKESVSGDFYWAFQEGNRFYHKPYQSGTQFFWSVVDCTGHGVPGGFMSMMANMLLNECAVVKKMVEPAEILNELKQVVVDTLRHPDREEQMYEGMDMALCILNTKTKKLKFAGAKNPLYLVRKNGQAAPLDSDIKVQKNGHMLYGIKGDPQPVGFESFKDESFQQHEIQLQKGDTMYLFSDGYPDQFGGPKGKKFMYNRLRQLLLDVQDKPMTEQKKILRQTIRDWRKQNDEEQIDDICVMGVKI